MRLVNKPPVSDGYQVDDYGSSSLSTDESARKEYKASKDPYSQSLRKIEYQSADPWTAIPNRQSTG